MSRLLLGALAALLLLPAAYAQVPSQEAATTVTIQGLPAEDVRNGSSSAHAFTVTVTSDALVCVAAAGTIQVNLTAEVAEANATGNSTAASAGFSPDVLVFTVPTQQSLRGDYSASQTSTLLVDVPAAATGMREYDVTVTATVAPGDSGCLNDVATSTATAPIHLTFGEDPRAPAADESDAVPGFGLAAALGALALVGVALRRRD